MAHRNNGASDSPGPSRQVPGQENRQRFSAENGVRNHDVPMELVEAGHSRYPGIAIVRNQGRRICIRGIHRLRNRGRQENEARFFDSPSSDHDGNNYDMMQVISSPDGLSSDSMMGDDHDLSDGVSSISDLEDRLPIPLAGMGEPSHLVAAHPVLKRLNRSSKSHKRTRTGSSSSDSSVDHSFVPCRKQSSHHLQSLNQRTVLVDKLQNLRCSNEFTDVTLVVDDHEIPCHKVVLAACSPYFHGLLSSKMKEEREGKVTIQGHKPEILEMLVRHAYAEPIKVTTSNAQDVVEAADYFQMDTLKDHCENFLIRQVAESNCLGLMQFASLHSLDRLHRKARHFAVRNFAKVSQQDEFLRLPLSTLSKYLADNSLVVPREEHVFNAAVRWLEFEESRKSHAAAVLGSVRLFFVSPRFLFDVVAKYPMFQGSDEVQEIIAEACKYHAGGSSEWKQSRLPHTRPRAASGISEVLVVVGGICNNRRLLYTECYHPLKRDWISLGDISTCHASMHSYSVCSHKNDVYITGGHSNSGMTVDSVSVYFSNIDQWSPLASMNHPRERHGSASVDGAVYVAGGLMASPKNRKKPGVLDNVERYKPDFNRWEKVKPLPKRCYSPGVLSYKEKLYVIGGVSMTEEASTSSKIILDCIQCYDPLKDSWSQLPLGRPLARLSCALYRDHFYMISNNASSIFRYDPSTCTLEQWRELHEVNLEFAGLAAFNGKLVISGGQKGSTTLNHMLVIDFETGNVEEEIKMKRSRCMHGCVPIDKFG
uniref:Kelch-like protein 24 n=1 Tax=Phallusia mammillata TaxID=59560 RepID=A0A6F9DGP8_9ASCI|nr:kelch-like protein 24 [Phallusia mammillata]